MSDQEPEVRRVQGIITHNPIEFTITPLTLLREALLSGNLDMFRMMKELYESERQDARRIAYNRAFAKAKAEFTPIVKTRRASFGPGKASYDYEELDAVIDAIVPALSKYGLVHSWKTVNPPDGLISVTCVLAHEDGYSEENTLAAAPDQSGNKNSIQAVQSTVTYLQRSTLKSKCGVAAGRDDDAHVAAPVARISSEDIARLRERMKEVGIVEKKALAQAWRLEKLEDMPAAMVPQADRDIDEFVNAQERQAVVAES